MRARLVPAICVTVGVLWAARSLLALAGARSSDPTSAVDWLGVLCYSAALVALAPGLSALQAVAGRFHDSARALARLVAVGALVAAAGNLLASVTDIPWASVAVYLPGVLGVAWGLVGLAVALALTRRRAAALVALATLLGLLLLDRGGGLVVLFAWAAVASEALSRRAS